MEFFRIKRKIFIVLIIATLFAIIIDEKLGEYFGVISGIILGISYYRFQKLKNKYSENENISKKEKEVVTMGKYKNFILKDNAKAYIPMNNENGKCGKNEM